MKLVQDGILSITEYETINKRKQIATQSNGLNVIKVMNEFKQSLQKEMQKNTVSSYYLDTKGFTEYVMGTPNMKALDIKAVYPAFTGILVQQYFNHLAVAGYEGSSIRRAKHSIAKFFEFIQNKYKVKCPNIESIDVIKENLDTDISALIDNEVRAIAKSAVSTRDMCIILFMYEVGLRRQELIECEKQHIDFNNCTVKIFNGDKLDRIGSFSKETGKLLQAYLKDFKDEVAETNRKRKLKGGVYTHIEISQYLFQSLRSPMLSYATVFKAIKDASLEYYLNKGMDKVDATSHSEKINTETLRQSRLVFWLASGKTIEQVQAIMGVDNYWRVKRFLKVAQQLYPKNF